jgi:O-antigen ligase
LREIVAASRHAFIAALFMACALVLGGGGSPNPGTELLLQLVFVAAALAWLWMPAMHGSVPVPRSRAFWLIAVLVLVLPLLQLVPLPPSLWTSFGGQADRAAALALVGREQSWQPLSHSPPRTLAALLAMIPAVFMYFATASLDRRGRKWVVGAVAVMAVAAALLGALQVSLGTITGPYLYPEHSPTLTGFQANRNSAADVLLIGMAATAALLMPSVAARGAARGTGREHLIADRRAAGMILAGVVAVLSFGVLLTASRTGIALLPLVLLGIWVLLLPALADRGVMRFAPAIAALAAIPVVAFIALQGNTALGTVAERFVFSDDSRRDLWRDGWFAMTQAWPFGVGMGGGQSAMIAAERLEVLDPLIPNRVHNDYLEFALEGGLPAVALLAAIVLVLVAAAWHSWRGRQQERHLTVLGVVILMVAAVHSFVDYPLRSMALACLVGMGAGLLMSTPREPAEKMSRAHDVGS